MIFEFITRETNRRQQVLSGAGMRNIITLGCAECKNRNYTTTKNKKNTPHKLEFKK
jgi:ribosomal protein L33